MADPNIQSITFPVSYKGTPIKYVAEINKQTGATDVYEQTPLGNRFLILKSYAGNNWKPELGPSALIPGNYDDDQKRFILTTLADATNNQRAAYVKNSFTQDQINNRFPGMPKVVNTAPPATGDDDSVAAVTGLAEINNVKPKNRGTLRYPLSIGKSSLRANGQDYIKFKGINYIPQTTGSNSYVLERSAPQGTDNVETIVTIILPIQPTIMDTNTVSWGEEKFGILQMIGSGISLEAMSGNASIDEIINKFETTVKSNGSIKPEIVEGIKASLAQKAIGSNNDLLSRLTGAVTNPNLTLLFNSPDLRNFNFNFKLSPRTQDEGTEVRKIIRTFKELMAVQRTAGNLFLEAPCVFEIEYIRGIDLTNKETELIHPSLNRIKTCALRNFSVNYTPSGSYMTYTDKEGTMTSYDLTMSFTELDPIYYDDYVEVSEDGTLGEDKIPFDQIGY